jgi:serine/threonine-protein phosphatase 2A activator
MGRRQFLPVHHHQPEDDDAAIQKPVKRILDSSLMEAWANSEAYLRLLDFLQSCNHFISNVAIGDECFTSPVSRAILEMLDELEIWIKDLPPHSNAPSRFGNIVFRSWIARLEEKAVELHQILLQSLGTVKNSVYITELVEYFIRSFGDGTRMDYGSGHELAFIAWLTCLDILDWISSKDYQAIVLIVFVKYLELVRTLQKTYNLEPGILPILTLSWFAWYLEFILISLGVWGLDDYQFIPYFWGAAQLLNHPKIKPKTIMNREIVEYFSNKYMYLACIDHINRV